tara:strand:- start:38747 stop:38914 length:168 start_codon:yes stop_codon:yes gene_type:complete
MLDNDGLLTLTAVLVEHFDLLGKYPADSVLRLYWSLANLAVQSHRPGNWYDRLEK